MAKKTKPANQVISEKRSEAAKKGWATRRRRQLERDLAAVRAARRAAGLKPVDRPPIHGKIPKHTSTSLKKALAEEKRNAKRQITEEELEVIRREALEEGKRRGRKEGMIIGHAEGKRKGIKEGRKEGARDVGRKFRELMKLTEQDSFWDKRDGTAAAHPSFVRVLTELDGDAHDELQRAYDQWEQTDFDEDHLLDMVEYYSDIFDLPESDFYTFFTS